MTTVRSELPTCDRSHDFELFELPDGRRLAFMEWGARQGFPVFYFHGTPSSRLEGAFADAAARRHGFRLVATDRPGFGRSTYQRGRRFTDWPDDVCALADGLGIDAFGVVGHSGGGPHLFACGARISPSRLEFIGALGPWGPVASVEITAGLNRLDRFYAGLARRLPWLMRVGFVPFGWTARYAPEPFLRLMAASVSPPDKAVMQDESFRHLFRLMEREAFRQGSRGAAHEATIAYRTWDFDIGAVRVPTHIWLGAEDIFVPAAMGRCLEGRIPGARLHLVPDAGHFNIDNWDDILAACARDVRCASWAVKGEASE